MGVTGTRPRVRRVRPVRQPAGNYSANPVAGWEHDLLKDVDDVRPGTSQAVAAPGRTIDPGAGVLAVNSVLQARMYQWQVARNAYNVGINKWRQYRSRIEEKNKFYISIEEGDDLYTKIYSKLINELDFDEQKVIEAQTHRDYDPQDDVVYTMRLGVQDDIDTDYVFNGITVPVEVTTRKAGPKHSTQDAMEDLASSMLGMQGYGGHGMMGMNSQLSSTQRIVFTCDGVAERDALLSHLRSMITNMKKTQPSFYVSASYGGWRRNSIIMRRPIDSVVLAEGVHERIKKDMETFLASEERYINLGLPWHHGYLFHGAPGTGKTSLAAALAAEYNFDVYYIALSTVENDGKFSELVNGVNSGRSILVMEDVDIIDATSSRDVKAGEKGLTLNGMLNALDGIATPHGLITIMTTNNLDKLDAALIRPGRVDCSVEIGYVNNEQFDRLCTQFVGRTVEVPEIVGKITPAEVVAQFKDGDDEKLNVRLEELVERANQKEEA